MSIAWLGRVGWFAVLVGCGPVIDANDSGDDESSSGGGTTAATGATTVSTTVSTTATTTEATSTTTPTTTATTVPPNPTATATITTDPTDPTDPTGEGLPDGEACDSAFQCASGYCYVVGPLGGVCGQCESDADCNGGGCTPPNPLASPPAPSVCNAGAYGAGCMSDDVCADGLVCALVFDVPGILTASTCSECETSDACEMGWTCEPDIAIGALTGVMRCVASGTLANGQTCDLVEGDAACGSGHCAAADVLGVLQLGVCSACESDSDCGDSMVCVPPMIDLMAGPIPGECMPV